MPPKQAAIENAVLIAAIDIPGWLYQHASSLAENQWFITPENIGRGLGLGWAQAMQAALDHYQRGWRLLADCGGHQGDAATAIQLGLPGILFHPISFNNSGTDAVENRLASMAEQRGLVFLTTPPPILTMA